MNVTVTTSAAAASAGSFWQRRVVSPLVNQLRQGITPEKLALTIALGGLIAVFPILGSATILCGFAAVALRLNQPIIQLVNYRAARDGRDLFHRAPAASGACHAHPESAPQRIIERMITWLLIGLFVMFVAFGVVWAIGVKIRNYSFLDVIWS